MRLPDFMSEPLGATVAVAGIMAVSAVVLGALWFGADTKPVTVHRDDRLAFDCKTRPPRVCGSDVAWQRPGVYPAPDGGTYTVTLITPYMACLRAANIPGPSGFAGEVCEPLSPAYTTPPTVTFVAGGCVLLNRRDRYCPVKP